MASTATQPTLDQLARYASTTEKAKIHYDVIAAFIADINALQALNGTTDIKESVRLATAAALPANTRTGNVLLADANGALGNIDSVAAVAGNRVLVKDEGTGANNGLYVIDSLGSGAAKWQMTRSTDADTSAEVTAGATVFVSEGTVNNNSIFDLTTDDPITLNTTALTFTKRPTLAELASTAASKGASLVGIQDAATIYTATDVEAALAEVKALADAAIALQKRTVTVGHADLTDAGNGVAQVINVGAVLPANAVVLAHETNISTLFSGGGATAVKLDVGGTDADAIIVQQDVFTGAATGALSPRTGVHAQGAFSAQQLVATFTPDGGHALLGLDAGSMTITVWFSVLA